MNKKEFLDTLREKLQGFPEEYIKKSLEYYGEMIDDRIENGESEDEAVAGLGDIDSIISQILSETPLPRLVKERVKSKSSLTGWGIALIIIGAPLWLPIILSVVAIILSVYMALWAIVLSVFAVGFALVASAVALTFAGIVFLTTGHPLQGLLILGVVSICTGVGILTFIVLRYMTKGIIAICRAIISVIKKAFISKEAEK